MPRVCAFKDEQKQLFPERLGEGEWLAELAVSRRGLVDVHSPGLHPGPL